MAKQSTSGKQKLTKKQVRQTVYEKLSVALSDYKKELKDKKFERNLKKASKLFAADITRAASGKKEQKKKTGKETAVEKTV